jgi:hypothetical protein
MVSTRLIALTLALGLPLPMVAAIDLTPVPSERTLEGIRLPEIHFSDGARQIAYEVPKTWRCSPDGRDRVRFCPPNLPQADAEIQAVTLKRPIAFDEEGLKALREQARGSIPRDSEQVEILAEAKNSVLIDGHDTFQLTIAYVSYGRHYQMSVWFLNIGNQQLAFKVSAHKLDFDKVYEPFRVSLYSWEWRNDAWRTAGRR